MTSPADPRPADHRSLQELRVADQELSSGNQTGAVYVRLSPGAVAFLTERHVAQARVSRHLRDAIDSSPVTTTRSTSTLEKKKHG